MSCVTRLKIYMTVNFFFSTCLTKLEAIPRRVDERRFLSDVWFAKEIIFTFGNSVVFLH